MAEPITIPDLENGKIDIDTLADIVNLQEETTVTRLSGPVKTWYGVMQDLAVSGGLAYETLAELQAITGTQGQVAEVTNDGDNTGRYSWQDGAWVKSLDTTSAKIEKINQTVIENKIPSGPYDFQDAVVTEDGTILWAVRTADGRVVCTLATQGVETGDPMLSPEFAFARVDEQMNVIDGIRWDGSIVGGGSQAPGLDLYVKMVNGHQQVKIFTDREIAIGSAGESYGPTQTVDKIEWKEQGYLNVYKRYRNLPFSDPPAGMTKLYHAVGYGQSLSVGLEGTPALLQTPPKPDLVFMFNGGTLPAQGAALPIDDERLQSLAPAANTWLNETPILSTGCFLTETFADPVLVSSFGRNGTTIQLLSRGSQAYDNMIHSISMAHSWCSYHGIEYELLPIAFIQGHANWGQGTTKSEYMGLVQTFYDQLNEDIKNITGQTEDIVIYNDQVPHGDEIWKAQIELSEQFPSRYKTVGPRYGQLYADSVHFTAPGYDNEGAKMGRSQLVSNWIPLKPISAVRSGLTVTMTFNNPSGTPLVLDTTNVVNMPDGMYGFRWVDSTMSATVVGVSVSGSDTVTLTLSAEPSGANPMIGIADVNGGTVLNAAGTNVAQNKRSNLRDSNTDLDVIGNPMYNWAVHYQIDVTN